MPSSSASEGRGASGRTVPPTRTPTRSPTSTWTSSRGSPSRSSPMKMKTVRRLTEPRPSHGDPGGRAPGETGPATDTTSSSASQTFSGGRSTQPPRSGTLFICVFGVSPFLRRLHTLLLHFSSDYVFGTDGDELHFNHPMHGCSDGKYEVKYGGRPGYDLSPLFSAPGVIELDYPGRYESEGKFTVLQLGEKKIRDHFADLGSPIDPMAVVDHMMFALPGPGSASGMVHGASSWYPSETWRAPGIMMHEVRLSVRGWRPRRRRSARGLPRLLTLRSPVLSRPGLASGWSQPRTCPLRKYR